MDNLTIAINTFAEIIFVQKPNEKCYEEVLNEAYLLL